MSALENIEDGESLRKQLAATQKDAARYRWLRQPSNYTDDLWLHYKIGELCGEELDALVDAAMEEQEKC